MTITGLAYGLSALVGAGIAVIGARFLLAPRAAAGATQRWLENLAATAPAALASPAQGQDPRT